MTTTKKRRLIEVALQPFDLRGHCRAQTIVSGLRTADARVG
jgi:hypothetical protein